MVITLKSGNLSVSSVVIIASGTQGWYRFRFIKLKSKYIRRNEAETFNINGTAINSSAAELNILGVTVTKANINNLASSDINVKTALTDRYTKSEADTLLVQQVIQILLQTD